MGTGLQLPSTRLLILNTYNMHIYGNALACVRDRQQRLQINHGKVSAKTRELRSQTRGQTRFLSLANSHHCLWACLVWALYLLPIPQPSPIWTFESAKFSLCPTTSSLPVNTHNSASPSCWGLDRPLLNLAVQVRNLPDARDRAVSGFASLNWVSANWLFSNVFL